MPDLPPPPEGRRGEAQTLDDVDMIVEGAGPKTIVMLHGWPDTHRLWDTTVDALKGQYRCVRFTLPGFEPGAPKRAYPFSELLERLRRIVEPFSPVTLLLHDWGCLLGYQFAMQHPGLVERVIGVDIGDAGSRQHLAEIGASGKLKIIAYQVWLALAWAIGCDAMARLMARAIGVPRGREVRAQMGYLYAMRWLGIAGGLKGLRVFKPHCPMLFLYGTRKPVMFHSDTWAQRVESRAFKTGHWVMLQAREEFNQAILGWLARRDA
jgi:pimeloyl-ACP methyl ester carboxylesterase